jgi:hypothetical protein
MRLPNFKLDWFVPQSVIGLIHFHADVTPDDVRGVIQTGQDLIATIDHEFHLLIDNRVVNMPTLLTLQQMQYMVPYMNHPNLRWVLVVKPEQLEQDVSTLPVEQEGRVQLKNVSTLPEAFDFLQTLIPESEWRQANTTFFPNTEGL